MDGEEHEFGGVGELDSEDSAEPELLTLLDVRFLLAFIVSSRSSTYVVISVIESRYLMWWSAWQKWVVEVKVNWLEVRFR